MAALLSSAEGPKAVRTFLYALLLNNLLNGDQNQHDGTFPKSVRLRKRADFVRLFDSPHKISVQGFLVIWQRNDHNGPRLGVTVSKKVGCAVIRNHIKRCTREIFRHQKHRLHALDINVVARRESARMEFHLIKQELEKAFRHIGAATCSKELCSS